MAGTGWQARGKARSLARQRFDHMEHVLLLYQSAHAGRTYEAPLHIVGWARFSNTHSGMSLYSEQMVDVLPPQESAQCEICCRSWLAIYWNYMQQFKLTSDYFLNWTKRHPDFKSCSHEYQQFLSLKTMEWSHEKFVLVPDFFFLLYSSSLRVLFVNLHVKGCWRCTEVNKEYVRCFSSSDFHLKN